EPEEIVDFIERDITSKLPLRNTKVLITAGPTYEAIDPVRFIGNHSSGKMGYALAETATSLGAQVILVSGPTHINTVSKAIQRIAVASSEEMYNACHKYFSDVDIAILSAAVGDFTT